MPSTSYATLGLLYVFNGSTTARWNFPEMLGETPSSSAGIGEGVTLSYSFSQRLPAHSAGTFGFLPFTALQREAALDVLASIAEMIDVRFVAKASGGVGQLTFANSSQPVNQGGFAYVPDYGYSTIGNEIDSVFEGPSAGDVWLNRNDVADTDAWLPGQDRYHTLLHEVGHALGLKHPFQGTYTLPAALDNDHHTVMTYTPAPNMLLMEVTGTPHNYRIETTNLRASTLMPMDIDALQYLYGANKATRTGNDTYGWERNEEILETIWDGGGRDTIDCANQVYTCIIDLEATGYSSIGLRQTYAEIRDGLELPAWFDQTFPASIYNGSNNLAIARGVVIENARGGSGADVISGNAAANGLAGNDGNDTLAGGAGNDSLNGGSGADDMTGGKGNDRYYVDSSGDVVREGKSGGTDIVLSYLGSYTLGSQVEDGRVMAGGKANLSGNSLDNELYAGSGNNVLAGGSGNDTVSYEYAKKAVAASLATTAAQATGGSGTDRLSSIENLVGSAYADRLSGNSGNNSLAGAEGNDKLSGSSGNDKLSGGVGNDSLSGGSGNDRLLGGVGRDALAGGSGKDIFDFNSVEEMGTSSSTRDVITDFARGQDDIDLSSIDAKASTTADDAFRFIGSGAFTAAGQVRYAWSASRDYGVLYGNTDSDKAAEFTIQVADVSSLSAADFIL